jgi:hypothetical protein
MKIRLPKPIMSDAFRYGVEDFAETLAVLAGRGLYLQNIYPYDLIGRRFFIYYEKTDNTYNVLSRSVKEDYLEKMVANVLEMYFENREQVLKENIKPTMTFYQRA